jgi:hypothetical protein
VPLLFVALKLMVAGKVSPDGHRNSDVEPSPLMTGSRQLGPGPQRLHEDRVRRRYLGGGPSQSRQYAIHENGVKPLGEPLAKLAASYLPGSDVRPG